MLARGWQGAVKQESGVGRGEAQPGSLVKP